MSEIFKLGEPVWAKMKGFPHWPGRIAEPPSSMKKPTGKKPWCIFFFGTLNYGWIEDHNMAPYNSETKAKYEKMNKGVSFVKAIKEVEAYIQHREENPDYDPDKKSEVFDQLKEDEEPLEDKTPKKPKKTPAKRTSTTKDLTTSSKKSKLSSDILANNGDSPHQPKNRLKNFDEILNRPSFYDIPDIPKVNLDKVPESLAKKDIVPSDKAFGFIGLGIMGSGIVKNLVLSGHHVNIWSRNIQKAEEFKSRAEINHPGQVEVYAAPSDIVQHSDIIFCCISDPTAVKEIMFQNGGIIDKIKSFNGKGYVELTNIDEESSSDISTLITGMKGRYVVAQIQGSSSEIEETTAIVVAAGDQSLFLECQQFFVAISSKAFYLGKNVRFACKTNLILQIIRATSLVALAEGLVLGERCGLQIDGKGGLLEILGMTTFASPYLMNKAERMVNLNDKDVQQPLQHLQKDLRHAINLGDNVNQLLFMASAANEIFKQAKKNGYGSHDSSFVYMKNSY